MPRALSSLETVKIFGYLTSTKLHYPIYLTTPHMDLAFNAWVDTGKAPALPETLKLYKHLKALGFKVVYITGREENRRDITRKNLHAVGYKNWEKLLLKQPSDSKKTATMFKSEKRAMLVKQGYRIWGNIGDQWSDILGTDIGGKTFKLPDPMYYIS
ncbi:acid phosphatase 1-like isoform X2 [Papaver somniferum]|uniref:acid phosphatase 1-like isoform X2 n=1 Tax=Papaver somniferum TaxID=3469 RepID=UPI000E6FA203|nr:acid phosphatase 1-like isoform X2 [Papaver somniferum]